MRQLKISKSITIRESHSLEKYLQEIAKTSLLSAEEEEQLARKIKEGDAEATRQLIVANLRFVVSVAKQYQNQGLGLSDLINEGNLGLVTAASRYDETKGFKFISYAVWWIRQSILQALAEHSRFVRLPLNKVTLKNKIARVFNQLEQQYERAPSAPEIADYLGIPVAEVEALLATNFKQLSIDAPVGEEEDTTLADLLPNHNAGRTDGQLAHTESLNRDITSTLSILSERQSTIIKMYFGIGREEACSLEDIARNFDLSRERVRQIKDNGIEKIRSLNQLDLLRPYLHTT
ncbi:sigma-70 family RNA polymerase sigma factor [Taibaiella chishuiensis]|uniref:RNA polymerase primary sigma factor n=1 Tax=Taibaiella chishuiensis TaxID=1434707 RepID=A0A2P8DD56_9BACT|nr:RNA polymerase sigma factor RpoD/SigA [Taibaiella chishuiensis]PSK95158.1 RNA polymerase primary sigma factor [Taibaiella chishuiensis]